MTAGERSFEFSVLARAVPSARAGLLRTPHGEVRTPVFMPVGTNATVKAVTPDELWAAGAQIILANTYHLSLRPGAETVAALGGIHRFMGWHGPVLTDSGGFQVFSLGHLRTLDDEGVTFRSHIDGSTHRFTPESVQALEEQIGADIVMPLDQCLALPTTYEAAREAMARTTRWLERSIRARQRADQALFGIVQGATFAELRVEHARRLREFDLPGYAIGGLSVGEPKEELHAMLEVLEPELPQDRPRYLMGVGAPEDLVEGVARGIDMFDVVLPTRIARNGSLLTRNGRVNLKNAQHARSDQPADPGCGCATCTTYSIAYLHHLYRCEELLVYRLATIHNLWFMTHLMADIRASIEAGTFQSFREQFHAQYRPPDAQVAGEQRASAGRAHAPAGPVQKRRTKTMAKRVRALVTGRVQNVGFRMFVLERARTLGLSGWVRNLPAGRQAELEAEGDDQAVDRLLQAVRQGPAGARVEDVAIEVQAVRGETGGLMVR